MIQYRITFWESGKQYCKVIGSTCEQSLRKDLNRIHDRYTMEKIT